MKYPRPEGSRTKAKRERENRERGQLPYDLVEKEVHGQKVMVKVYNSAWAAGDKRREEELGLKKRSPFGGKISRTPNLDEINRKLALANAKSMEKFPDPTDT